MGFKEQLRLVIPWNKQYNHSKWIRYLDLLRSFPPPRPPWLPPSRPRVISPVHRGVPTSQCFAGVLTERLTYLLLFPCFLIHLFCVQPPKILCVIFFSISEKITCLKYSSTQLPAPISADSLMTLLSLHWTFCCYFVCTQTKQLP